MSPFSLLRCPFSALPLAGVLFLLLAGCSSAQRVGGEIRTGKRPGVYIPNVPSERQATPGSCGANALATLLGHWGIAASQRELDAALYIPSIKGALTVDLWRSARARGVSAWETEAADAQSLKRLLAAGAPPLLLVKRKSSLKILDHFLVVTGHDAEEKRWIVQSGKGWEEFLSEDALEREWSAAGRWALLAALPDTEPADLCWAEAVPGDWRPRNNLAERRIAAGRLDAAEAALNEALALAPGEEDDPAAWVHLQDTQGNLRLARGDPAGALADFCEALRRALKSDLPEETLKTLRAHRDKAASRVRAAMAPEEKTPDDLTPLRK